MQRGEVRNSIMVAVLPMVTCGIYAIIWMMAVMKEINAGLGREEYNVNKELILTLVTCGMWGIWLLFRMTNSIVELQTSWGVEPQFDGMILFVILLVFAPAGCYLMQEGLNQTWEQGTPGGAGYGAA